MSPHLVFYQNTLCSYYSVLLEHRQGVFEVFDNLIFGSRLRQLRQANNLSLKDVADEIGTQKSTIGNIERGDKSPSIDMMLALANYFDVSLDYLTGRSDNPPYKKVATFPKLHLRIKELLERENLTLEGLSEKTEIELSVLRLYISGEMNDAPDPYVLAQIADVGDWTSDYLLGLVDGFHRGRVSTLLDNKVDALIKQIDEIIKEIDSHKYTEQRFQNVQKEITEYRKKKNEILSRNNLNDEHNIKRILKRMLIALDDRLQEIEPEKVNKRYRENLEALKISLETSMRLAQQTIEAELRSSVGDEARVKSILEQWEKAEQEELNSF